MTVIPAPGGLGSERIQEPRTPEDQEQLFKIRVWRLGEGPLIKLMRWFSFFESMVFMEGHFWQTKMLLDSPEAEEKAMKGKDPAFKN